MKPPPPPPEEEPTPDYVDYVAISNVPCRIESDDLGLFNVFIEGEEIPKGLPEREIRRRVHEGEILMPEWIVRGEGPLDHAIEVAGKVIAVRRKGHQVSHRMDAEGRIAILPKFATFEQMEQLREDFEKRRDSDEE